MNLPAQMNPRFFIFNGDADGIISQHIAELSGLLPDVRITGLKREIRLLNQVPDSASELFVFDINLETNRDDLMKLLQYAETRVHWYDHHEPGPIPDDFRLKTRIMNTRGTCTALLVHAAYPGADPRWAAMAAFGDNLPQAADALLAPLGIDPAERERLREAGELINYNSHGDTPADVLFQPLAVAERMSAYRDPLLFLDHSGLIEPLRAQMREDEARLGGLRPVRAPEGKGAGAQLFELPAEAWARRLGSTFASRLALAEPGRAVATLQALSRGEGKEGVDYQVSIRAPRGGSTEREATPASSLALEFPTGGGRALAAGINRLPADQVDTFVRRFFDTYG